MSLTINVGDTLNSWGDSFGAAAGMLISKSDDVSNWGDSLSKFSAWQIQFGDKLSIKDKLFADFLLTLSLADNLEAWSDALSKLQIGLYTLDQGDSINNLNDIIVQRLDHRVNLGSAITGHADKVKIFLELRKNLSDDLDNWQDSLQKTLAGIVNTVQDSDSIDFFTDLVTILLSYRISSGDDLNSWLDNVSINQISDLNLNLADTLAMSDNVAILLTTRATTGLKSGFDDYIRKYLNDPKVGN